MSAEQGAEHPSLVKVAVMLAAVRAGKVKGSPREMAEAIISQVFEGEMEKWDSATTFYQGGDEQEDGSIKDKNSKTQGSHHRKVTIFMGEWEEGAPAEKNGHPLTGKVDTTPPPVTPPTSPPPAGGMTLQINTNSTSAQQKMLDAVAIASDSMRRRYLQ